MEMALPGLEVMVAKWTIAAWLGEGSSFQESGTEGWRYINFLCIERI